jgi:magnesium-protoporphyrin O-methyltransferase
MTCHCEAADRHFGAARAAEELAAYRRHGPSGTAGRLLRLLRKSEVRAETLLDIGAGVGVLHHELLAGGVRRAVHVEASRAYAEAARAESVRRGHDGRVEFVHGDFVALAPSIMPADLVSLDRVLCCYDQLEPLVAASASRTLRYWAASFPRDRWYVRLHARWQNLLRARTGNPFRTFIHPVTRIYELLRRSGLRPVRVWRRPVWEVVVCVREDVAPELG